MYITQDQARVISGRIELHSGLGLIDNPDDTTAYSAFLTAQPDGSIACAIIAGVSNVATYTITPDGTATEN